MVMVAGNMPIIPDSLLSGVRTMTANIVLEMGYAADLHREALIATGVVLFVFVLLTTMLLSVIRKRVKRDEHRLQPAPRRPRFSPVACSPVLGALGAVDLGPPGSPKRMP